MTSAPWRDPPGDTGGPLSGALAVSLLGRWQRPGPVTRIGFVVATTINRHDFGVSWNAPMDKGGVVVGEKVAITEEVAITLDAEAILESDMNRIARSA